MGSPWLPVVTSGVGAVLAFTALHLTGRRNRWGFMVTAVQTFSWVVVGPLTGQWFYLLTGLVLPWKAVGEFRRWSTPPPCPNCERTRSAPHSRS